MKSYVDGLEHAANVARAAGTMAHACGQVDCALLISVAISRMISAEIDREDTPPRGAVLCQCCGQPVPASR